MVSFPNHFRAAQTTIPAELLFSACFAAAKYSSATTKQVLLGGGGATLLL